MRGIGVLIDFIHSKHINKLSIEKTTNLIFVLGG